MMSNPNKDKQAMPAAQLAAITWMANCCDVDVIQDECGNDAAWCQFNATLALALPTIGDMMQFDWVVVNGVGFWRIGSGSSQPARSVECVNRNGFEK